MKLKEMVLSLRTFHSLFILKQRFIIFQLEHFTIFLVFSQNPNKCRQFSQYFYPNARNPNLILHSHQLQVNSYILDRGKGKPYWMVGDNMDIKQEEMEKTSVYPPLNVCKGHTELCTCYSKMLKCLDIRLLS